MNKRDTILNLVNGQPTEYVPAAFFLHFGAGYESGQAAVDRQMEFFRHTGMDLVKIQYEQKVPDAPAPKTPTEWAAVPVAVEAYFEPTVRVVEGLVKAARGEALVVLTLYSPFMWVKHFALDGSINQQFKENSDAVNKGLERATQSVINLVKACKKAGVDGFYASTQGGEATRFAGTDIFEKHIKPSDLAVWDELASCTFNILHVCDYDAPYDDLTPFLEYPGHVVNSSLHVGGKTLTTKELSAMFKRPFMGGLERTATIATGSDKAIKAEVNAVLAEAPEQFILGADCTVPGDTPWDNLKTAIDAAHGYKK